LSCGRALNRAAAESGHLAAAASAEELTCKDGLRPSRCTNTGPPVLATALRLLSVYLGVLRWLPGLHRVPKIRWQYRELRMLDAQVRRLIARAGTRAE
jgi:hypothetical protein